ncbi:MAG TPA: hypothetical protein VKI64_05110 [Acidimicrobiales bacterium]|nr:hypothetical protein [Acidimicrobiales bacterium]
MRIRSFGAVVVTAVSLVAAGWPAPAGADPSPPPPGTTCTWGGTPVQPTGTFTISPGVTSNPLSEPARFYVTGALAGNPGCSGTLTYIGQIDAGGTCSFTTFDGKASGIPGVTSFAGIGIGPFGPARLYDKSGKVVASENADVNTVDNIPHYTDCYTPQGFTGGNFSSVIVFADQP